MVRVHPAVPKTEVTSTLSRVDLDPGPTHMTPPRTARRADAGRNLGPFARFVEECLRLVGAGYADPVALINAVGARLDTE